MNTRHDPGLYREWFIYLNHQLLDLLLRQFLQHTCMQQPHSIWEIPFTTCCLQFQSSIAIKPLSKHVAWTEDRFWPQVLCLGLRQCFPIRMATTWGPRRLVPPWGLPPWRQSSPRGGQYAVDVPGSIPGYYATNHVSKQVWWISRVYVRVYIYIYTHTHSVCI